jgi:hypothetical protein
MHHGTPLEPHFISMVPHPRQTTNRLHRVIARTRSRHMVPRPIVEAQIDAFFASVSIKRGKQKKKFRRPD